MTSRFEDLPAELFLCIFDHFWAHELFFSFSHLNNRIEKLIVNCQLHINAEHQDISFAPKRVRSLTLNSSPICLDEYSNLRSLKLIRCHLNSLRILPETLLRLALENTDLPLNQIELIFQHRSLVNVHLNLHHQFVFPSSISQRIPTSNRIRSLTMNFILLNDLIHLLRHLPSLCYLRVSLFGMNSRRIPHLSPLINVTRVICLPLNVPFDVLAFEFLSIYFPNVEFLSIFTSFVDHQLLIDSLENLFANFLHRLNKFSISAQIRLSSSINLETISTRFRTAFWLKRNVRVLFKFCQNDAHDIRLYLQTNRTKRRRPSRFVVF